MRVVTTYMEGELFIHVRMTIAEARAFRLGGHIETALLKRIDKVIRKEPTIGG